MSKINIGVGDEFPLDESRAGEGRDTCKTDHHKMRHMLRALRHAHHEHPHYRHHRCWGRGPEVE